MIRYEILKIPYALVLERALEKNPGLNETAALEQYKKSNMAIAKHSDCPAQAFMATIACRIALELWQIYTIRRN
jgi:hypothetical protein